MESRNTVIGLIILLAIIAGAWYWYEHTINASSASAIVPSTAMGTNGSPNQGNLGQPDTGSVQQPQSGSATTQSQNLTLKTATDAKLGSILTAANGMTLYAYAKDGTNKSNCTGACAANWPPYTIASAAELNALADISGTLGTTARADGSLQVTYKGTPLYFYVKDAKAGDTTGEGVGGVWSVVHP